VFKVVERRTISDELASASERWVTRNGLTVEVDEEWLELVCEDGDVFTPENRMLHLAVPPCEVAPGDSADLGRTQTVGEIWPDEGAPAEEVPKQLALALTFEHHDDAWIGKCALPPPIRDLFTTEDPAAMLSVLTATRRTLGAGALSISGDPGGRLSFTIVDGAIAASASTEARIPEPFTYWLGAGPAMALEAPLRDATRVEGGLGARPDLIITNDLEVEGRCLIDDDQPPPPVLPEDHFESQPEGRVDGLRVDREGGVGREALAAIAALRPGEVTLAVADDGSLVISGGDGDDATTFTLDGPGFTALGDRRGTHIVVPYVVALAIYDGASGGAVDLTVDARWGRLHRADLGLTVEWTR
jgi:hypothetical protein